MPNSTRNLWSYARYQLCLSILVFLCAACFRPGGGGRIHHPPAAIARNTPTELLIEFSVWGAGSGRLDKRYTDAICQYRTSTNSDYVSVPGIVLSADEKRMTMRFVLPPLDALPGSRLAYHFEVMFDGHANIDASDYIIELR